MKFLLITLIIFLSAVLNAQQLSEEQQFKADSISAAIKNAPSDTLKVRSMFELINVQYRTVPEEALKVALQAKALSEKINYPYGKSEAYSWLGYLYQEKGDLALALKYNHKSLKIREEENDSSNIAISFANIAQVHSELGEFDKAIEYHHKALGLFRIYNSLDGMAATYNNLGTCYVYIKESKTALAYFDSCKMVLETTGDQYGLAYTLNNMGVICSNAGDKKRALELYTECLHVREKIGDQRGISLAYCNMAAVSIELGHLGQAQKYAEQALKTGQLLGFPDLIRDAAKQLVVIYEKQNKGMEALDMHRLYIDMRDSVNSAANQKALIATELQYQYEKQALADSLKAAEEKKLADARHESELLVEKAESAAQKQKSYFLYAGLLLALLFGGFIFNRFRVTSKQKEIITSQKHLVEEKQKEIVDSITYAKRIQKALLPPVRRFSEVFPDSFVLYLPKDIVAGDFYWMESCASSSKNYGKEEAQETILFAAADCTGHGVPGAMVSVVCNNGLNRSVREYGLQIPGEILDKTRELVVSEFEKSDEIVKDGMDISLVALRNKPGGKTVVKWAGANNPLWIIRKNSSEMEEIKPDKQPIGKVDNIKPFTTHTLELQAGDQLYIFTDGLQDQFGGEKGKKFKAATIRKLLLGSSGAPMSIQRQNLYDAFETWKQGIEQVDDICVIGVRI